jgi:hypothetical protein
MLLGLLGEDDPSEKWTIMIKFRKISDMKVKYSKILKMDIYESVLNTDRDIHTDDSDSDGDEELHQSKQIRDTNSKPLQYSALQFDHYAIPVGFNEDPISQLIARLDQICIPPRIPPHTPPLYMKKKVRNSTDTVFS